MTDVAIYAHALLAVAIYTPPHVLVDFAAHALHLAYEAVTCDAIEACADVRLVREESISRRFEPVDTHPGWLLAALGIGC